MIWDVAYIVGSAVGSGGAARPGTEGIVPGPRLVGRLGTSARVTVVSAPPGSGKTMPLRSWISQGGAASCAAWVPVGRAEHDPQQFWLSVLAALRQPGPVAVLVQPLTAAPDLDGWAIIERLLTDLAPLNNRVWLVLNDVHEFGPAALSNQPRTQGQLQTDIVAPGRSWSRSATMQAIRISSKNGRETADDDLWGAW